MSALCAPTRWWPAYPTPSRCSTRPGPRPGSADRLRPVTSSSTGSRAYTVPGTCTSSSCRPRRRSQADRQPVERADELLLLVVQVPEQHVGERPHGRADVVHAVGGISHQGDQGTVDLLENRGELMVLALQALHDRSQR